MRRVYYCNITYACNNDCKSCISYNVKRHNPKLVTQEDYLYIVNKFGLSNNDIFTISGGEPTLSKCFNEIVDFCKTISNHIIMYSNGRTLNKIQKKTISSIERIIVPLYGANNVHNEYVGSSHAFEETTESLCQIIQNDKNKIDIKILLDNNEMTESLFSTKEWEILSSNNNFSVTRVINDAEDPEKLRLQAKRASIIIKDLITKGKNVRFYDFPFCMLDEDLKKHVIDSYTKTDDIYDYNVICGSANLNYKLFDFHKPADYFEKCQNCQVKDLCVKIMQNYFCPITNKENTTITTE